MARHPMLSEHLCRFFDGFGVDTVPCVGLHETIDSARAMGPDLVICDYDLLTNASLHAWASDPAVRNVPLIAVSLTRRPSDVHLFDASGIAGFLYLPTLEPEDVHRLLGAVRRKRAGINPPNVLPWPAPTPAAHLR
jgi:DNA-binding NarL/FixJ family response regulator